MHLFYSGTIETAHCYTVKKQITSDIVSTKLFIFYSIYSTVQESFMRTTISRHVKSPAGTPAWGQDSLESAWWLGCSSRDPVGPSPNKRREAIPHGAHHLQGEP
ncbi:hypothetical protein ILYODFUR_039003 [Ilyodon furcidens]|uniref:Uncharacterized protein n=1 Tax=Ilyodon furcidens TaxID=33524 RepID=A0ABV0URN6_9TELE